ncbi:hypothetical protein R3P38DRAFT_2786573 [Favolaschia claudopus]|uniref:JmjC domain-containing protein n=1 Tax=Favolaschia claudopus TaxID=2862362 RepID=A0AAW0ARE7_9AGAR
MARTPFVQYTMVSSKAVAVLERLARWPSPLPRHEQFPLPPSVQTPTGSFLIDDLLALGQDLINYHDLCAQDSTPMDTVASVMDLLLKSYLTQPWRTGHRVVSMSNIAATDRGMLRCRLGWETVMGRLGSRFVFGDYHWQYTLDKVFPAPPATLPKFDRARKEYLDRRDREPWAASVRTPPGWFSDMHTDFAGLAQAIVHFEGEKLWLLWPATAKNLKWWRLQHPQPWIGHPSRLLEALDSLEGLEIMHVSDPCAFIDAERRAGDIGQASSERRANTQKELEQRKKAGAKRYEEAAKRRRGEWKRRRGAGKRRVEAGRRRGVAGRRQTWVPQCRVGYLKRGGRQISRSEVSAMEADDSSTQDEDDSSSSSCAPAVSAGGSGERRRGSGEREQELASGARGNSERRWWRRRPEAGQRQTQVPRCDTAWGAKEGGAAADRDGTAWLNPKDRRRKWDRPLSSRDEDEEDERG